VARWWAVAEPEGPAPTTMTSATFSEGTASLGAVEEVCAVTRRF